MKTFGEYKDMLESLGEGVHTADVEANHISADAILKMILWDVAKGNGFSLNEVNILIELYDKIEKWYA